MKDLNYYKNNCEEDYLNTPISVLRYITELEEKLKEAINYKRCSTQLMRDKLLKSREETAKVREATAIQQTLEIYCDLEKLPTVDEVLKRIGRKH